MNEIKEKSVEVSRTEVSHLLCNRDMNGAGRLFGGQLLMWIDEVAGIVANANVTLPRQALTTYNLRKHVIWVMSSF